MTSQRRVLLHVGTPKTGTSFVQHLLFSNRETLARQGILYPGDRPDAHFLAALDLMEMQWGGLEKQAVGAWDRLAAQVREWTGTVIVSHEILAHASAGQVRRALTSLGGPDETELHVVLSVRDLARQVPAEWQENVKHRRIVGYRAFLEAVMDPARSGRLASWFWAVQEVPDILNRWAAGLPAERVHVITVPKPGAPPDLLRDRFASVFGLDQVTYEDTRERSNPSLGVPETALVRRINQRVNNGVLANEDYRQFVRELLVHRTLSSRAGSPRLGLPADVRQWAIEVSETWIGMLEDRDYHVVGDLAELRPEQEPAVAEFVDPDRPDEEHVADAALHAIVTLLGEVARMHAAEHTLREDLHAATRELDRARGLGFRVKRKLVRLADTNRVAAVGLAAYRRLRGSSSRSA